MGTAPDATLREQIRILLIEHAPAANSEAVETTLDKMMAAIDPFEKSSAKMLDRYRNTFARLAK